jgi:hypothetical protein
VKSRGEAGRGNFEVRVDAGRGGCGRRTYGKDGERGGLAGLPPLCGGCALGGRRGKRGRRRRCAGRTRTGKRRGIPRGIPRGIRGLPEKCGSVPSSQRGGGCGLETMCARRRGGISAAAPPAETWRRRHAAEKAARPVAAPWPRTAPINVPERAIRLPCVAPRSACPPQARMRRSREGGASLPSPPFPSLPRPHPHPTISLRPCAAQRSEAPRGGVRAFRVGGGGGREGGRLRPRARAAPPPTRNCSCAGVNPDHEHPPPRHPEQGARGG